MPYKSRFLHVLKYFLKASKYASGFSIAVVGFLALSMFWAWGVKLNTDSVNIFPSQYVVESGNWINPDNILTLELSDNAISDEFTAENSTMPVIGTEEDEEQGFSSSITVREFDITELRQEMDSRGTKSTMEISELRLMLSMAALADTSTPGVLDIEVSVNSKNRHKIAEIKQNTYYSNSINGGYYSFLLDPIFSELNGRLTSNDIENLQVFVTYKTENSEPAALQIDSIWLSLDFELVRTASARPKVKLDKGENVLTYKDTFSSNESPVMTFSNPELSLQDIKNMAEAGDVEVVEDKFRTLTKKNIVFEMLETGNSEQVTVNSEKETQTEKILDKLKADLGSLLEKEEVELVEEEATGGGSDPTPVAGEEEAGTVEEEASGESEDGEEDTPKPVEDNPDTKEDSDNMDNQDSLDNTDTTDNSEQETGNSGEENTEEAGSSDPVGVDTPKTEEPVADDVEGQDKLEDGQVSFNPFAVKTAYAQSASIQDFSFYLVNPRGERAPADVEVSRYFEDSREMFDVQIKKPENSFIPGKYTLEAELETADSIVVLQQDFSWGVLAINFNKSIYTAQDSNAYIQMGVLDDFGHTLCNAELELKVSTPNNKISYFTTEDESIKKSEYCNGDSYSPEPDYFVNYYLSGVEGVYDLELTATTQNGTRSITDSFEVRDSVLFDVERTGPTRIFPLENYKMRFIIIANEDFEGEIVETIPADFAVMNNESGITNNGEQENRNSSFIIRNSNNSDAQELVWTANLQKGDILDLSYTFDPPNISPEFYLLGPLEIGEFSEIRQWQIASDAILPTLLVNGNGTGPRNWATQAFGDIDEGISGADGIEIAAATTTENRNASLDTSFTLANTPADFLSMDDISYNVIYRANSSTGDDTLTFEIRIVNGATILAAADAGGTFQTVRTGANSTWPTTATTSGATGFTFVNTTANQAAWDGAEVEFRSTHAQNMGPEDNWVIVDTVEFTGNYTPSATTIDISGSSDVASATVAVAVNSTRQTETATTAAGPCPCAWSITGVSQPGTGDVVTVWLDGVDDASESTAVTLYSGTGNVTGLELDANVLSIGTTGAYADQSLTVSDLALYDADSGSDAPNEDVMHTANSGVLSVEAAGNSYTDATIRIEAGDTLTIGGTETLDTHNVQIDGTLTSGGAGTFTVSGSWDNNSVFNTSGETVTFTSTSTGETIDSTGAATAAFNDITFNGLGGEWGLGSALTVNGDMTITTGTFLSSQNVTVGGGVAIGSGGELSASASATLEVGGSWTNSGTFTHNGGSVTFNAGSGTVNIDSTGATLDDFNNIIFNDGGGTATFLLASALDVNGDLTITGGTLDVDATDNNQINVAGNWTNNDIFEARSGLVVLDGLTSANLNAGCTAFNDCANGNFFNLEINKTDGADANDNVTLTSTDLNVANTLTITDGELIQGALNVQIEGTTTSVSIASAGEWFNISTGNLILDGDFINNGLATFNANGATCGDADDITITNITNIPDWDGTGTFVMKDVTISNQNAIASITLESSTNGGGNTGNFTFGGCSITIQGNVLQDDEATFVGNPPCDGATAAVSMRINGGTESTVSCADTTGQYTFGNITPNAGDTLTIYLNSNSTPKANLVLVVGASDVLNAHLYQNTVIVRDEDDGTLSILDTLDWDSSTEGAENNMLFDSVSGTPNTITLNSGVELHIWTGDTFDPGGTVTTQGAGDVHVAASAIMHIDDGASVIAGDVLVDDSATFQVQQNVAIQGGDIATSGTGATVNYTGTPTVTISGTGSIGGGTTPSITFYNLTVSGTQTMASATTTENNLTVNGTMQGSASVTTTVNGDVAGSGIINFTGGTFEQRVAISQNFGTTSGTNNWTFNNLTFSNSDGVTGRTVAVPNGTGTITINGNLLVSKTGDTASITLDAADRTWVIAGTGGNPFDTDEAGGILNGQNSTFEYTGDNGAGDTTVQDASYTNLTFTGAETYVPEGATSASGDLTINTNAILGGSQNITVNGSVGGNGTVNITAGTFEQRISAAENFGTASGANSWTFNDLTFSNADGGAAHIVSVNTGATGAVVVNGIMRVSNTGDTQATTLNAGDKTYTLGNTNEQNPLDIDLAGGVLDAQTSTFEYAGDFDAGDVHIEDASYYNLTLGGAVVENYNPSEAAITVSNDLTINANGTLIGTNNVTVNGSVTGAGAINLTGGLFTQRVSAAENFGTTSSSANWTFNNLTMSNADSADHTITANSGGTGQIIVGQTFTIGPTGDTNGTTFDNETNDRILDMHHVTIDVRGLLTASSTASFTVSGNWTNDGTLNEGTGTVEFDGATSATIDSGCTDVDNCTSENFNNIEINKTAGTDADDNITLINTHLRLSGTLTITDGELIQGAQNVRAEGATAVSISTGNGAAWTNTSSGNLTLGGSFSAGDGIITFQGGGVSCGDFDSIQIRSTDSDQPTPTQRIWSGASATFNFNDVNVADQGTSGITITVEDGTDAGGNDAGWNFVGCPSGAATFSMRPDGDVTTNWGVTGSTCAGAHWCTVNDNVDDPSAPDFTDFISASGNTGADRFTTTNPTDVDTATQIIPKVFMDATGGNNNMQVSVSIFINGSQVGTTFACANATATATWCSGTAITGSWTQADINTLEISLTASKNGGGPADTVRVSATYAELTYTPSGITIEGNIYEDEATTALVACDGTTNMVAIQVGATSYGPTTCADASGFFSISAITEPAGGTPIFIYASGCSTGCGDDATAVFSTTVIRYSGSGSINNAVARRNRLILRHDDGGPVTNLNLDAWDNADDSDIVYNVDDITNELVVEDGIKLIINTFNNFTPGADVSTSASADGAGSNVDGDILIQTSATLGMQANALSVGGDFTNQGTFSKSAGQTTTFTATATGHTIADGGNNFENIIFNGTNGGWSFADSTVVDGDITMTAGTLSGTNDITVNGGDVTGAGTINLTGGNFTIANSDGTANLGGGSYTFNNLTVGDGDGLSETTQLAGDITVSNTLTIATNDTLDASNRTVTLNGTGIPFVINGTFAQNTSSIVYKGAGATEITATGYWNLESSPAATVTHRLGTAFSQSFTVNNQLVVGDGTNAVTFDVDNYDPAINLNGNLQINANAVFSASNTAAFNISGDFTNSGTFTHNGGGIEFDQAGTSIITGSGTVFNNFTSTTNNKALRFGAGETFRIDGLLTLTGTSGNEITIDSSDGVSQWLVNHQGTENITFTNIKNSGCDASSTDINAFIADGNIDGTGNGSCWIFFEFIPASQNWRWYDDENNETPVNPLAAENTAPSGTNNGDIMKLRFTVAETNGGDATDIRYKIQFSTQSNFSSVTDVAEIGICGGSSGWCYADGAGIDDALIPSLLLSDSNTLGTHNESGTTASTFDHQANAAVEFEFTLRQSGASADTTYFFRAYDTLNDAPVAFNTGEAYPSITTGGTTLDFQITGVLSSTTIGDITTTLGTSSTQVNFGILGFGTDEKAAQTLTVTTNATSGYSVYMYQRQSLLNSGGAPFTPVSGTNASPAGWSCALSVAGCYGYHTTDDLLSGGSTRFAMDDTYAAFSTSPEEVAFSSVPVSGESNDMVYRIQANDMQEAGDYETQLVYIIVPVF